MEHGREIYLEKERLSMFKKGDIVKLRLPNKSSYSQVKVGRNYLVNNINQEYGCIELIDIATNRYCGDPIVDWNWNGFNYDQSDFELYKKDLTLEVDFLDAFQNNFREGI